MNDLLRNRRFCLVGEQLENRHLLSVTPIVLPGGCLLRNWVIRFTSWAPTKGKGRQRFGEIAVTNNYVYALTTRDTGLHELWRTDGTVEGTEFDQQFPYR